MNRRDRPITREDLPVEMRAESMFGKEPTESVPVILARAEWALVGIILTEHANQRKLTKAWQGLILEVADEIRQAIN